MFAGNKKAHLLQETKERSQARKLNAEKIYQMPNQNKHRKELHMKFMQQTFTR